MLESNWMHTSLGCEIDGRIVAASGNHHPFSISFEYKNRNDNDGSIDNDNIAACANLLRYTVEDRNYPISEMLYWSSESGHVKHSKHINKISARSRAACETRGTEIFSLETIFYDITLYIYIYLAILCCSWLRYGGIGLKLVSRAMKNSADESEIMGMVGGCFSCRLHIRNSECVPLHLWCDRDDGGRQGANDEKKTYHHQVFFRNHGDRKWSTTSERESFNSRCVEHIAFNLMLWPNWTSFHVKEKKIQKLYQINTNTDISESQTPCAFRMLAGMCVYCINQ